MKKFLAVSALTGTMLFNSAAAAPPVERETINQIALLQSLTLGYFDGSVTVSELKTLGDTGIGTFNGLDGELIMLDGVVYRANQECEINVVDDSVTIPFSNVTFFDADYSFSFKNVRDKTLLEDSLNKIVNRLGKNAFYMIKLTGDFNEILVRSEAGQVEPYPTLVEALKTQKELKLENVSGTIVGLYCPPQMQSLNTVGWHFHFVTEDKKFGGHVLGLNLKSGEVHIDKTENFNMKLPSKANFNRLNLGQDLSADIHKAENESRK